MKTTKNNPIAAFATLFKRRSFEDVRERVAAGSASACPPSRLPDSSINPEYRRWRRANGLENASKWNNSERGKERIALYRKSEKGRATRRTYRRAHETPDEYAERVMKSLRNVDLY